MGISSLLNHNVQNNYNNNVKSLILIIIGTYFKRDDLRGKGKLDKKKKIKYIYTIQIYYICIHCHARKHITYYKIFQLDEFMNFWIFSGGRN